MPPERTHVVTVPDRVLRRPSCSTASAQVLGVDPAHARHHADRGQSVASGSCRPSCCAGSTWRSGDRLPHARAGYRGPGQALPGRDDPDPAGRPATSAARAGAARGSRSDRGSSVEDAPLRGVRRRRRSRRPGAGRSVPSPTSSEVTDAELVDAAAEALAAILVARPRTAPSGPGDGAARPGPAPAAEASARDSWFCAGSGGRRPATRTCSRSWPRLSRHGPAGDLRPASRSRPSLIRYTRAIDTGDWDRLDEVFTPDAQIDYTLDRRHRGGVPRDQAVAGRDAADVPAADALAAARSTSSSTATTATVAAYFHNPMGLPQAEGPDHLVEFGGHLPPRLRAYAGGLALAPAVRGARLEARHVSRRMDQKPAQGLDGEFARRVIKLMSRRQRGRLPAHPRPRSVAPGASGPAGRTRCRSACSSTAVVVPASCAPRRWSTCATATGVVVVASQAGRPQHPLWFRNLAGRPRRHRPGPGRPQADAGPHRRRRPSAPSSGRGSSTSTPTTTPTSPGPTARSRSWSSSRAEAGHVSVRRKFPVSERAAVTIRQRGAWPLDRRWPRRLLRGPIASPVAVLEALT